LFELILSIPAATGFHSQVRRARKDNYEVVSLEETMVNLIY